MDGNDPISLEHDDHIGDSTVGEELGLERPRTRRQRNESRARECIFEQSRRTGSSQKSDGGCGFGERDRREASPSLLGDQGKFEYPSSTAPGRVGNRHAERTRADDEVPERRIVPKRFSRSHSLGR